MQKPIPIGIEDYKEMIDENYYYVDKTLFIRDLLDKKGKVSLFTRPRRFGKTLALSMLRTFFEKETDVKGNIKDNSRYFTGMKIMEAGEEYLSHLGKYPIIFLSLKSAKQPTFEEAHHKLKEQIASEFKRHRYVLTEDILLSDERKKYEAIMLKEAEAVEYSTALQFLSECLEKYHGEKVIILLDEYDVPLENAYSRGFYEQMTDFIRSLFESALKTNEKLKFAVITGCLRICKESIFTGLNNLEVISILNADYAEYFGFTEAEVADMLGFYGLEHKMEEAKEWYDGYLFGNTEVYNPWSIINYVRTSVGDTFAFPKPYWSNTSSNSIVRELVEKADDDVKQEIERLIAGGSIEKAVHEDITYADVHESQDNLWNFLFFTGYLKKVCERKDERTIYLTFSIPNEEILSLYENTIREWFEKKVKQSDFMPFYEALMCEKCEKIENFINSQLAGSISYYDNEENFYHGYMLGILSGLSGYEIRSNREYGEGRPDIMLRPFSPKQPAIIFEFKRADKFAQMEEKCNEALRQIEEKKYDAELIDFGYQKILKYGICFCRKNCMVKTGSS